MKIELNNKVKIYGKEYTKVGFWDINTVFANSEGTVLMYNDEEIEELIEKKVIEKI